MEGGKTIQIGGDAGNGAQLLVGTLVRTVLESTVQVGIDPMVFYLLQGGASQNLPTQGEELIVPGLQGKALLYGVQSPLRVPKVAVQLATWSQIQG